jgi:hypothetical protein
MSIRQKIDDNPIMFVLGAIVAGFLAGIGTYRAIIGIAQLVVITRAEYQQLIESDTQLKSCRGELKSCQSELQSYKSRKEEPAWPHSSDGKYEAVKVSTTKGWQYQVTEVMTKKEILITQGHYDTPNDVKAGLFSPDSKRIAAAYHYKANGSHNRDYTWVGIWNIETGDRVDVQTIDGLTTNIYWVFKK